jgi:uncharacterized protein (TIGR03032 family)
MKLAHAFTRLPLRFDTQRLIAEVVQFDEHAWRRHPQGHPGNSALPLIASGGDPSNEDTRGPMRPTPLLQRCPYIQQVLAAIGAPIGRTRLMRIAGRGEATAHVDTNYYWAQRVRVHVPVLTYPGVRFLCGDQEAFMDGGESWIFDTWRSHNVLNPDDRPRIHLVADTVGSDSFWRLVAAGDQPHAPAASQAAARFVPFVEGQAAPFEFERTNFPAVMSPWEVGWLIEQICGDIEQPNQAPAQKLCAVLARFQQRWRALWACFGAESDGRAAYGAALAALEQDLGDLRGRSQLANGLDAATALQHWIIQAALAPEPARPPGPAAAPPRRRQASPERPATRLERPIFIVAAPRSGSSLLFETLARAANVFTVGGESHALIEQHAELHPETRAYESNRLGASDATPQVVARLTEAFSAQLRDRDGRRPAPGEAARMLEKTPKNALRIPFLAAAFPDARFIYLYREPTESLASIMEAWASGRFVTYPQLPDWHGRPWSLLLTPGWRRLAGQDLAAIAAAQWSAANQQIMHDLGGLPGDRWRAVSYDQLLADPQAIVTELCRFAELSWDQELSGDALPLSRHTLTPPAPGKWRAHAGSIDPLLPALQPIARRARQLCYAPRSQEAPPAPPPPPIDTPAPAPAARDDHKGPLRSIHTTSFPALLHELGISVLASTYQAGRLVILRPDGELLNTHFRAFPKPMGLALDRGRLAVGTQHEIREFHNVPSAGRQAEHRGKRDACFVQRRTHTTGDIQIHEMAWAGEQIWFVNTRFSCLCTLEDAYSFVPRWRPWFISALAPEDRCHLNGLALLDGRPRYVTALGATDTVQGWREHKRDGGVLLDVEQQAVLAGGLSMPHSPRWYADRLWVLNSGAGSVGVVDPRDGRYEEVARLPGFTRGLDFYGRYAFVGLSQIRESAVFSGIAIAGTPIEQRSCGVWVLDIVSGQTVAFVKFEDAVQEIFAVQVAAGMRYPDVAEERGDLIGGTFVLPDTALADVPLAHR